MEMQELEITIDQKGRVQVAVRGVRGGDCLSLSENIEKAVGMVEGREYTGEYYEQPLHLSGTRSVNR